MRSNAETFGSYLKKLRAKRGLSLREAADLAGLSKMYICQLENNALANPTMLTIYKISVAYNASIKKMVDAWSMKR